MEEYKNVQNLTMVSCACANMLAEKFNVRLPEERLKTLIHEVSKDIISEYGDVQLKVKELNNITLSKIKNMYQIQTSPPNSDPPVISKERSFSQPSQTSHINQAAQVTQQTENQNNVLDDDTISHKLKELEARRKIIPSVNDVNNMWKTIDSVDSATHTTTHSTTHSTPHSAISLPISNSFKPNPISITLPSNMNNKLHYKNFIINSLNRDWEKSPGRNFIKFNISFDLYNNVFYPQCICFPKHIKNITPYVLMKISDVSKSIFYSFTCLVSNVDSKWDVWYPVDDVESISLQNKAWSITFHDFTNNELDIGADSIQVIEASKRSKNGTNGTNGTNKTNIFTLKIKLDMHSYDNNFMINDIVYIKTCVGKTYLKKIVAYEKTSDCDSDINIMTIIDEKNELVLEDFIDSKIMNTNNQYSIFIKYHYNKL